MWLLSFLTLASISLWLFYKEGPYRCVGVTAALSLLTPAWLTMDFLGLPLDVRSAATLFALGLYCIHPKSVFLVRLTLVDYAGLALLGTHLVSDLLNQGWEWNLPLRIYGEWALPYLAGRQAIHSWEDFRWLVPWVGGVALVLACGAVVESLSHTNPVELLFGEGHMEGMARNSMRWGLKRAIGPVRNPIYHGTLQLLLLPWAIYLAVIATRRKSAALGGTILFGAISGLIATASRAPLLGILVVVIVSSFILMPRLRYPILATLTIATVLAFLQKDAVLEFARKVGEESPLSRQKTIVVDNEPVKYSSTLHRVYLMSVYGRAMRRAGWFGFGTERTSVFPPNVPIGPEHFETLKRLWCVDNVYILYVLRFGYIGVLVFVTFGISAAVAFITASRSFSDRLLPAMLGSSLIAVMLVLLTVWMPRDFGFWFLWTIGLSAGLRALAIDRDEPLSVPAR